MLLVACSLATWGEGWSQDCLAGLSAGLSGASRAARLGVKAPAEEHQLIPCSQQHLALTHRTMALPPSSPPTLTPAQVAIIPSRSLPIASQLSHLLAEFTTLSLSLFSVLSSSTPSPTSTSTIYASLSALDQKLVDVLSLAAEHQRQQRHIDALVGSLRATDLAWRSTTSTLHSALSTLTPIITSGALDRQLIPASAPSKAGLTPSTLLS